jgi:outer membrane protein OmpA-like peptidoglycan-associated protein
VAGLALCAGLGCITTAEVEQRATAVDKLLAEQREPMYNCTPVELAKAEAHARFARHESSQGRPHTALPLIEDSEINATKAYENSRDRSCLDDRDGDGIPDREDECPDQPGPAANKGCPVLDSDGDGLPDKQDRCPYQPGPKENGGCPWLDSDGDGLPDNVDKCPKEYGPKENEGCPYKDRDKDGIPDNLDKCPDDPGPKDNDGCPYKLIQITDKMIILKEKVFFAFGKSTIKKESNPLLNEIAQALKDHPTFVIRIEGHTDNIGSAATNKKLSQARADAVRKYLVGKGIGGSRLTAVGYGLEQPIDDNSTDAGRSVNRRVEFHIVSK